MTSNNDPYHTAWLGLNGSYQVYCCSARMDASLAGIYATGTNAGSTGDTPSDGAGGQR